MAKIMLPQKMKMAGIALAGFFSLIFGQADIDNPSGDSVKVSINDLESKVASTLMFGGSSPVSFSGEGRLKLQHHQFWTQPKYAGVDKSWTEANWEGNENMLRLGMVVRANRNTVLWSKIGFQSTLPGIYTKLSEVLNTSTSPTRNTAGFSRQQTNHDKLEETAVIHEDMCAGLAIRSVPASFWFKMGSIIWTEASPFTIWKAQPRQMAWDYLPYEIEQPIDRYYDYNMAKGAKEGRASWHKKALQGLNLESISLPWDLYFNSFYGVYERYDSEEREFVDWSGDLAYTSDNGSESKQRGIGDSYHNLLHLRLAKSKLLSGLTLGFNYLYYMVESDIGTNQIFSIKSGMKQVKDSAFYKEPQVFSLDVKGPLNNNLELQADVAISKTDTTFFSLDSLSKNGHMVGRPSLAPISPAVYGHLKSAYGVPATIDLAYVSKGFYSPLSFAAPIDAFFPFGSNLVGAGKFLARAEASPYVQNMAGALLGVAPDIGEHGHIKFSYGQHFQIETARDLLFFPYRLNGQDFYSLFASSYNRWDQGLVDDAMPPEMRYDKRLGDQSYRFQSYDNPYGPDAGGLRFDYLSVREGFVPYESAEYATANYLQGRSKTNQSTWTTIYSRSAYVPQHRKYTFNLESDIAYNINNLVGYDKDLFLSLYGAINGVSTSISPIAFDQKDQLLWSLYLRFEPTIKLSHKFWIIGIAGYENWKADKAWMWDKPAGAADSTAVLCPIDFRDYACGIGFDWDMAARVGLHARLKWMSHQDMNFRRNDWKTPVISTEIKMWY